MELVLPMYNAHPYFSLENLGKSAHYTWQNTVYAKNKSKTEWAPTGKGVQYKGICPSEDWRVDFTDS